MAFKKYSTEDLVNLEDRLRTITERLKQIREMAGSLGGSVELQLGSFQPYLKRLDQLTDNALTKCQREQRIAIAESKEKYRTPK